MKHDQIKIALVMQCTCTVLVYVSFIQFRLSYSKFNLDLHGDIKRGVYLQWKVINK